MTVAEKDIFGLDIKDKLDDVIRTANGIILGKEKVIRLALACLIGRGHLLIEDMPGVGKTTLAHVLANTLGLSFQRIQFTSDLLPADILGASVFNRDTGTFSFHPGPIFSQVILADEVNRATPRAQSALLEAMEENQVTIEGETRTLPRPFFVIATQNPSNQVGTFQLPESQLDRFNMRLQLGYPDGQAERELLKGRDRRELLAETGALLNADQLLLFQRQAEAIHVADPLLDYLQNILTFSRANSDFVSGLSPRAGLAILSSARGWALLHGHKQVLPEDIQTVIPSVIGHRIHSMQHDTSGTGPDVLIDTLLKQVPIP